MNKKIVVWTVIVVLIIIGAMSIFRRSSNAPINTDASHHVIEIVAAENFWGSLISQLGGTHVNVVSIVSDPNADPHEYESSATNAREVATADYVVENGAGYDSWMDKLLSAGGKRNRKILNAADLLDKKDGANPHFWYYPEYLNQVVAQMEKDLVAIDPANSDYYNSQYALLQTALKPYQDRVASIKQQFNGTKIAATESIFVYPAQALGLNLVSSTQFMNAIDEGNDPSAQSVIQFENLLKDNQVKVLVYNEQTITPITLTMKKLAGDANIPVVGITETIQPPDVSFQDWMNSELINLENALNANALGK